MSHKNKSIKGAEGKKVGGTPEGMRQTYRQTGKVEGLGGGNQKGSHNMPRKRNNPSRGGY